MALIFPAESAFLSFCYVGGVFDHLDPLAVEIEDRVVGGLDPNFLATLAQPLELFSDVLASIEFGPELSVFGTGRIGVLDKHAVMLVLDLCQGVAQRGEKIVVRRDDRAIHVEFDHCLRLGYGLDFPSRVCVFELLLGVFDHLDWLAVEIEDRVVGSLDPNFLATFAQSLEFFGDVFTPIELGPKFPVLSAGRKRFLDKHPVVLTLNLL